MKLSKPLKNSIISQHFGQNGNTLYKAQGLLGHPALDCYSEFQAPIYASHDAVVSAVGNKNAKDLQRYRAVYTIFEEDGIHYELSYGHCWDIFVEEGQQIKQGDIIGTEGNTGRCYSDGVLVTNAMKQAGTGAGHHLHWQLRLIKKVPIKDYDKKKKYLTNSNGKTKLDDCYFEIPNYTNGYSGCIDPEPFLVKEVINITPQFTQTLRYGSRGEQVKLLQKKLGLPVADGIFGLKTEIAVKLFQKSKGLKEDGIVGLSTRIALSTV